jgi:signal transduction histidine kinase
MHQFTEPSMLGFAYYALRSLGSPRLYFRFAIKMAPHYNRVSEATILQASNTHLRMCYRSLRPEGTRLLCEGRMGQIAGAPTLWGLPPATVREVECQALGASACIYDLHWLPMFRPVLRGLCGALLGAGIGFLLGGARISPWCAGLGTLLALAHGYRAQAKAKTGHLLDSAEGYVRSLEELRAQFKEVRRLNIEMEAAQKALLAEMHGRQRAETDLIEAKKLEALGRLAGGIAHDFNNILTVIRVDAKFAREILLKSGDPLKNLDSITEAAERASHLTRRLLTFARRQTVEAREIVLEDYVQQMKDMLAKLAGDQATLEFDLAGEKSTVFIDPGQLEQVLLNLTVNARDAMPHGGWLAFATRRVSLPEKDASVVADLPPGAYVVLTVTDTGIGMGPATLERIFEPFFTTKNARIGTGLGLATSHGIVHQAQGDLRVKSAPGHGTTFFVYLPRQLARHA